MGLFCVGVCAIVRRRLKKTIEGNKRVWFALRRGGGGGRLGYIRVLTSGSSL